MKALKHVLFSILLLGIINSAQATIILSLETSETTIDVGDSVAVDVVLSGLGDFSAVSVSSFVVEVLFDSTVLNFDSESYTGLLGDIPTEADPFTSIAPGSVTLDLLSFLFDFELDALQPESFTLGTLNFSGLSNGVSALSFGSTELIDTDPTLPVALVPDAFQTSSVNVASTSVPEPAPVLLMLFGSIAMLMVRKKAK